MKTSRGFAYIILVVIIAAFAALGVAGYMYSGKTMPGATQGDVSPVETGAWKTYTDSHLGFTFKYPSRLQAFGNKRNMRFGTDEDSSEISFQFLRPSDYETGRTLSIAEYSNYDPNDTVFSLITIDGKKAIRKASPQIGGSIYIPFDYNQVMVLSGPTDMTPEFEKVLSSFKFLPVTDMRIGDVTRGYDNIFVRMSDGTVITVPYPEDWGNEGVASIQEVDINFDGYDDLQVFLKAGAYNSASQFYTYNPRPKTFDQYQQFDGEVILNEKNKTLETYWRGRGLGDMYSRNFFEFINGKWQLVKDVSQTTIDGSTSYDGESGYYARETRLYKEGKVVSETVTYYHNRGGFTDFNLVEISPEELPF